MYFASSEWTDLDKKTRDKTLIDVAICVYVRENSLMLLPNLHLSVLCLSNANLCRLMLPTISIDAFHMKDIGRDLI